MTKKKISITTNPNDVMMKPIEQIDKLRERNVLDKTFINKKSSLETIILFVQKRSEKIKFLQFRLFYEKSSIKCLANRKN